MYNFSSAVTFLQSTSVCIRLMSFAGVFSLVLLSSHPNLSLLLPFTLSQSCQKGLFLLCGKFLEVGEMKNTQLSVICLITESYEEGFLGDVCMLEAGLNVSSHQAVPALTSVCQRFVSLQSNIFLVPILIRKYTFKFL